MRQYILAPAAEHDIEEIVTYIAQDNPAAALALLDDFIRQWINWLNIHSLDIIDLI